AASAVFRLGECYRKLGKTNEASAQYERILRKFADQGELAALSRQHLPLSATAAPETLEWAKATAELARLRIRYGEQHPQVQEQLAFVQSLERNAASRGTDGAIAPT